jgi:hypothetical protein
MLMDKLCTTVKSYDDIHFIDVARESHLCTFYILFLMYCVSRRGYNVKIQSAIVQGVLSRDKWRWSFRSFFETSNLCCRKTRYPQNGK